MKLAPQRSLVALFLGALWMVLSGCTTPTSELPDGPKIVVDGNQYVTLDAPVGSHIKKRIRVSELREPSISPAQKNVVTEDSDTNLLPPTAAEMARALSGAGGR